MNPAYEMMRQATFRERVAISIRISAWLSTRILPVSPAVKNELVDMGIPSSKLIVCLNTVEVRPINGKMRSQAKEELGYKDGEIVFTTVGHAGPVKGWDILLSSFARIVGECPSSRLQLVGSVTGVKEREHYSVLENCIRKWGIADYVSFLGQQPDITNVLAATDVFVLPSRSEGNSGALLEAMTYRLPCIATKVGYAPDLIENGVNGLLVERGSEDQLSNAMISLAKNPKLRSKIVSEVKAKDKYAPTFSEYGDQLVEIYKRLLQANRNITH
jgi:glycosyltransferase involved in cell wall biosynthesis